MRNFAKSEQLSSLCRAFSAERLMGDGYLPREDICEQADAKR